MSTCTVLSGGYCMLILPLIKRVLDDGVRHYREYRDLLTENLDVLFVCLPNYLAPEVTIAGLESGMHVLCEKPPGRTVEDIARVINIERQHPLLKLKYGFNHRYHHSVRDALNLVKSKELGSVIDLSGVYGKSKIINFDSTWRTKRDQCGGGILWIRNTHGGHDATVCRRVCRGKQFCFKRILEA